MQLYFIRHGQSVNNALWAAGTEEERNEDPELTGLGERQAKRVAEYIQTGDPKIYLPPGEKRRAGFNLTHLYASLMVRALQTGTYISQATGVPLEAWEAIHECGGINLKDQETGEYICMPGKTQAYFREHFPHLKLQGELPEAGWWNNRPIETPEEWQARAQKFLFDLMERHGDTDDRVGIVSHGGFYMEFARAALKLPPNGSWLTMYNTALSLFDFKEDGQVELIFHNRVEHLPGEMVT